MKISELIKELQKYPEDFSIEVEVYKEPAKYSGEELIYLQCLEIADIEEHKNYIIISCK